MVDKITTSQRCLSLLIPFSFLGAKPPRGEVVFHSRITIMWEEAKKFVV